MEADHEKKVQGKPKKKSGECGSQTRNDDEREL